MGNLHWILKTGTFGLALERRSIKNDVFIFRVIFLVHSFLRKIFDIAREEKRLAGVLQTTQSNSANFWCLNKYCVSLLFSVIQQVWDEVLYFVKNKHVILYCHKINVWMWKKGLFINHP